MRRLGLYIGLFVSIIVFGNNIKNHYHLEKDYHTSLGYKEISKSQLLYNFDVGMLFIMKSNSSKNPVIYKVGETSSDDNYYVSKSKLENLNYQKNDVLALILANKISFGKPYIANWFTIRDSIESAYSISAFSPNTLTYTTESSTTFNYSDVLSWKAFPIFLIMLMLLLVVNITLKKLPKNKWYYKKPIDIYTITLFLCLVIAEIFVSSNIIPQVFTTVFPLCFFCILAFYHIKKRLKINDFIDREATKFLILFGLSLLAVYWDSWWSTHYSLSYTINEKRIIFSFYGFLFCSANLFANLINYLQDNSWDSSRLLKAEEKVLKSEATLSSIQSSVNPHFLYNSLNSIATLTKTDPIKTEKMTLALSAFYKYVTNREGNTYSSLEKEIEMINTYLEIEKIRFEDRLKFEIEIQDGLEKVDIPNFLIQPLVENAIKYGYDKTQDTIEIKITASQTKDDFMLKIFDKGQAFDENLSKGYGLRSVTKKLQLLYPDRHEISFNNNPKHVSITLKMNSDD